MKILSQEQRTVAIVGRPNVGKSTLFNRLAGQRLAIVHEQSGITRDRLSSEVLWDGQRFELVDTGGINLFDASHAGNAIDRGTRFQVDVAIQDAPVILFVVNIREGVTPLDIEVAKLLHESGRRVLLIANKADHPGCDEAASEFEALGFPIYCASAMHNRGLSECVHEAISHLPDVGESTTSHPLKVAIVGRPNVGKSSYINRLLRNERVIVSEVPGTTQDSVEIPFHVGKGDQARHYLLIDTAGLRARSRTRTAIEKFSIIRTQKSIEKADVVALVLDSVDGPTSRDKKIAATILEQRKGCLLLVNKWDLTKEPMTQRKYLPMLQTALPFLSFVPVLFLSAETGYNIRKTIDAIDFVGSQIRTQLPTATLNKVLHKAVERTPFPRARNRSVKFFYATQVGSEPIRIRLFVNHPKHIPSAYRSYLSRALRTAFGLEGAPILLQFRARPRD